MSEQLTLLIKPWRITMEEHELVLWCCDKCNWLTISDSREHHKMDFCKCKNPQGVDLESYHCRILGDDVRFLATLKLVKGEKWKVVKKDDE